MLGICACNAFLRLLLLLVLLFAQATSNWLYLAFSGISSPPPQTHGGVSTRSLEFHNVCSQASLNDYQRSLCLRHPYAIPSVGSGAKDALVECQWQFKFERWNCTYVKARNSSKEEIFGPLFQQANKETAFISAISSAGIAHSITRACSAGNLSECGCDTTVRRAKNLEQPGAGEKWHWDGCSDDVLYGIRFSERFLDKQELEKFKEHKDIRYVMNVHNHKVGRLLLRSMMQKQCRCHGVSGSCELKTCWRTMPKFGRVGETLKERYDRVAVQIARRAKKRLRRKDRAERKIPIRDSELVYVNRSPNYCERNEDLGILGTEGRECNRTSFAADSCDLLCCGRGYNTKVESRQDRCHCKFVWCCYVKCKNCTTMVDVHTCK